MEVKHGSALELKRGDKAGAGLRDGCGSWLGLGLGPSLGWAGLGLGLGLGPGVG